MANMATLEEFKSNLQAIGYAFEDKLARIGLLVFPVELRDNNTVAISDGRVALIEHVNVSKLGIYNYRYWRKEWLFVRFFCDFDTIRFNGKTYIGFAVRIDDLKSITKT